ncbi:MAG: N-acetylmuramoyl-L-alanine amidase [Deltaproteobacteria bacterium]|nr:N-acetylmuramoyl-L-alanine amidase [Deltaproteobacteria bacterium]
MRAAISWLIGLAVLCSGAPVSRADPPVAVSSDGLCVEATGSGSARVLGPGIPGQLRLMGDLVGGLLSRTQRREIMAHLPALRAVLQPGHTSTIVVIDPGHGGSERGARGVSGTREKDLVLAISKNIREALRAIPEIRVLMTREGDEDVGLWQRVEIANQAGAQLFISVHANAFVKPSLGGVETFFHSVEASDAEARRVARAENAPGRKEASAPPDALSSILADMKRAETLRDSSRLAHLVQEELARALPFDNLGVRQADFVVLRGTRMPAVLLELGFMTNRREERILKMAASHDKIAQAVKKAVLDFLALMRRKGTLPPAPESRP